MAGKFLDSVRTGPPRSRTLATDCGLPKTSIFWVRRNCQQRMADERPLGRPYGAARVSRVTRAIKAGAISWRAKTSSTSPVAIAERGI